MNKLTNRIEAAGHLSPEAAAIHVLQARICDDWFSPSADSSLVYRPHGK